MSGSRGVSVRFGIDGVGSTKEQLESLGNLGDAVFQRLTNAANKVKLEGVSQEVAKLDAEFRSVQRALDPAAAGTQDFARAQEALKHGLRENLVTFEQFSTLLTTARERYLGIASAATVASQGQQAAAKAARDAAEAEAAAVAEVQRARGAFDSLRASLDPAHAAQMRFAEGQALINGALARQQIGANDAQRLTRALSDEYVRASTAAGRAGSGARELGTATGAAAQNMRALAVQMPDVVQQLLSGQSAFMILVQQGGQVVQVTGGVGTAMRTLVSFMGGPYVAAGVAVAGALALVTARSASLATEQRQLDIALRGVGKAGEISAAGLTQYVRQLEAAGTARDEAQKIVADLARTQGLSGQDIGRVAALAPDVAAARGTDTAAEAKLLADAYTGAYDAIRKLDDALNVLTPDQRRAIAAFLEHGEKTKALDVLTEALTGRFKGLAREGMSEMDKALKDLRTNWSSFMDSIAQSRPVIEAVKLLNESVQGLAMMTGVAGGAARAPAQPGDSQEDQAAALFQQREALRQRYEAAVRGEGPAMTRPMLQAMESEMGRLQTQIEALRGERDRLRAGTASVTGVLPDSTVGPAELTTNPGERQRQQNLVDERTQDARDQLRLMALPPPQRAAEQARLQAQREARDQGITDPAAQRELIDTRVRAAQAQAGDGAAQGQAAIERQANAYLTLAGAAEQGRAALLRAKAETEAMAKAATEAGVDVHGLTEALIDQAAAEESSKAAEMVLNLREQIAATQRLTDAESRGAGAAYWAQVNERVVETTKSMEAARDATTDPEIKAALTAQIERVRQLIPELARETELLALKKEMTTDRASMEMLQRELDLVGESADVRDRELATLKAIQEVERRGGDRQNLTQDQVDFIEGKRRLADMSSELRRQQNLYQELGNIGANAMDRIGDAAVQALFSGEQRAVNFGNVLKGVAISAAADFAKIALLNPLANAAFGGSRTSLFSSTSLSGSGGIGDILGLGDLLGGKSIGELLGLTGAGGLFGGGQTLTQSLSTGASTISGGGLSSFLGPAALGFGAGATLNSLLGRKGAQATNGTIGAGVGGIAGAAAALIPALSAIPGIGPILGIAGGLLGGGLGGMIGPGESVKGYGYQLVSGSDGLLKMGASNYNQEGQAAFQEAAQGIAALNQWMSQFGITVGGAAIVGGNKNGADYSHATAGSFGEGVGQLYYHSNDNQLEAALAARGNRFGSTAELQQLVEGFSAAKAAITALTAEPVPAFTQQLQAIAATFGPVIAQAEQYGLSLDGVAAAQAKATAALEAQRTEFLLQSGASLEVRRLRAEGRGMEADLAQQAENARKEWAAASAEYERWAISAEDKAQRLVELEEVQAAERADIIRRYGEQETAEKERQAQAQLEAQRQATLSGTALLREMTYGSASALAPETQYFSAVSDLNAARQKLDAGGSLADYAEVARQVLPIAADFLGRSERLGSLQAEVAQVLKAAGADPATLADALTAQARATTDVGEMQAALLAASQQELVAMRDELTLLRRNQDRMFSMLDALIGRQTSAA